MKNILVVGAYGQDGLILSQKLESEGHLVVKIGREFPLLDFDKICDLLQCNTYDEIYYLAAFHSSSERQNIDKQPTFINYFQVNHQGPVNFIEAMRIFSPQSKFFFAGSSHLFGKNFDGMQSEETEMKPICFYGISKLMTYKFIQSYRSRFNLFLVNGILYNHESIFRKDTFLSKKVIKAAFEISLGKLDSLEMGNLDQKMDWGYAPNYVDAMRETLQVSSGDDYIISSGELHDVREFIDIVFTFFNLDYKKFVTQNTEILTGIDRGVLHGNNLKVRNNTNWRPLPSFKEWIEKICTEYQAEYLNEN